MANEYICKQIQAVLSISETHNRTYPLLRQAIYQEITNFTGMTPDPLLVADPLII